MRKWREEHTRRSEETVEIWEHVLSRDSGRLGDELWPIMEQIVIASLDCSRHDLAIECIQVLNAQFPKSSRVTKLQALRLEAIGKYDEANYLYDKLLETEETNGVSFNFGFKMNLISFRLFENEKLHCLSARDNALKPFRN